MRLILVVCVCLAWLVASGSAHAECLGDNLLETLPQNDRDAYRAFLAHEDAVPNGNGRFWRVEREGVQPSHLFGTFHTEQAVDTVPNTVWQALDEASFAVFELSQQEQQAMRERVATDPSFAYDPDAVPLSERLTPEQLAIVEEALETREIPLSSAEQMRPWLLFTLLAFPACHLEAIAAGAEPLDNVLTRRTVERGISHESLETYEQALDTFRRIRPERFFAMLVDAGAMVDSEEDIFRTQFDLYAAGRIAGIDALGLWLSEKLSTGPESVEIYHEVMRQLIEVRNHAWLPALETALLEGGAFVAVGALHLPGEDGLISLLRDRGWTVTRLD